MIKRLVLVRHGETVDNARGVAQGWSDSELSERGCKQVALLARRIAAMSPTALYSSTLARAVTTADVIAAAAGLEPVALDALKEMNCGEWEGVSFDHVRATSPAFFRQWSDDPHTACPGGESFHDVQMRLRNAFAEMRARAGNNGDGACVVAVSHGTAIRIAATELLGLPLTAARNFAQDNTALNVFDWRGDRYVLKVWNDSTHCSSLN